MKLNQAGTFSATLRLPQDQSTMFHTSSKGSDGLILDLITREGHEIQHVVWLTANTYDRAVETLFKCFGFDGDFSSLAQGRPFPRTQCTIVTEMEKFTKNDGSTTQSCKVKWLNPAGGVESTSDLRGVLDRLRKLEGKPVARTNEENVQDVREGDEEIPF